MEFMLLSSATLTFTKSGFKRANNWTLHGQVDVGDLDEPDSVSSDRFLNKLKGLLLAQPSLEGKKQRLINPIERTLKIDLTSNWYGGFKRPGPRYRKILQNYSGKCRIKDYYESDGLLKRLAAVCGGSQNVKADVELEFGAGEDKMSIHLKDSLLKRGDGEYFFITYFNYNNGLIKHQNNRTTKFTGTLSVKLKLNDTALNRIYLGSMSEVEAVTRKLLEDAEESGDTEIVADNGMKVRCHKVFLVGQSDVFRAMFNSGMKEAQENSITMPDMSEEAVRILLAYLYCRDIQEALSSSLVAVELLRAADKYGISKLAEIMKDLILIKEDGWFTVATAIQLFTLARNWEEEEDEKLAEIKEKARAVLKSKSTNELKQCAEFREQFENPDNGIEMWVNLLRSQ